MIELDNYSKALCIGLKSSNLHERANEIKVLWSDIKVEKDLFRLAQIDEVASHLGWLLNQTSISHASYWVEEVDVIEKRIKVLMDTLEEVARILAKDDIPIVALKNAGIAKGIYPIFACSPMGDIDLLVSSRDFHKAHEILLNKLGFIFKFRSELEEEDLEEAFKGGGTEYYKEIDGYTVWLELQWRPIAGRWIQPHNEPNGDELIKRSNSIDGSAVRILSPEDNLLQVCLHTAKHSYVRAPGFRLHSDVDRIIRYQDLDWDVFTAKVLRLQLKTAVYFSLHYATQLLETPIPEKVFKSLKPVCYRKKIISHFVDQAGIFNQKRKKFSKVGYIIFNLALYDSIGENLKAIFPPLETMKMKYPNANIFKLPYYWGIRLLNLITKRAKL